MAYNRRRRGKRSSFTLLIFFEVNGMKESDFQSSLIKEIKQRLPGSMVLKNDPTYIQGIPDLTILYKDKWATLEVKKSNKASTRPNQPYYVKKLNEMSFSAIIFPENKEEVLDDLERSLQRRPSRRSRVSGGEQV